jgi:hypothetical protein
VVPASVTAPAAAGLPPAPEGPAPPPAATAAGKGGPLSVWILAGQSNGVGWNGGDGQELPAAAAPYPGKILMYSAAGAHRQQPEGTV